MRLFFAAPLEETARAATAAVIERLAKTGADYKWVDAGNLHLTLAFLGETPDERLPALKQTLEAAVRGKAVFTLVFDQIGAFDSLEHPRVLWLGASSGADALSAIAAPLIPPEEKRPFQAHLTLGRRRSPRNASGLRKEIAALPAIRIESRVDRILLLRSRLSSEGPKYEELARSELKGGRV